MSRKGFRPEEEFLASFFFDDVQLVVVPQSTGHLLIRHIVSVLLYDIKCLTPDTGSFFPVFFSMGAGLCLWSELHQSCYSPCGFPRDVPDHLDPPLWTHGSPGLPIGCILGNVHHTTAGTHSPTAICTLVTKLKEILLTTERWHTTFLNNISKSTN